MDDLISRQEAIEKQESYMHDHLLDGYEDGRAMIAILKELPPAEPERKKGKWIEVNDYRISGRCSVCGWESHLYEDDVVGMDFCPNCGADMRGEQDE